MVVFIKYTTMTNDDRGHRSSFGATSPLVLITKGGVQAVSVDYSPTTKRRTTCHSSFSRCVAVSDVALCHACSFAGADDVATSCLPCQDMPCLPCQDVPCLLWAVDGCSPWWFVSMRRGLGR